MSHRRNILLVCLSFVFLILVFTVFSYLSGFLIFTGRTEKDYNRPVEAVCNDWHREFTYSDRRPSEERGKNITIPTCEEIQKVEVSESFLLSQEGLSIRMVSFPDQEKAGFIHDESPIWFHVHGVTSSWLHGARYIESANRLGFRLLLVELQNHGKSERHDSGSSWGCREKWDIIAALERIKREYPEQEVLLTATSMGTISSSLAAIESPEAFEQVRALVYESPISNLEFLSERIFKLTGLPETLRRVFLDTVIYLSKYRTDVDFASCFPDEQKFSTDIPTYLMMSRQEYRGLDFEKDGTVYPYHSNVRLSIFDRGSHSAYWNYQPEEFEEELRSIWEKHHTSAP